MVKLFRTASATITNLIQNKSIVVRNLRIDFNLAKTKKAGDNKGKINIHNLSSATRDFAQTETEKNGTPKTAIALNVGYADGPEKLLFFGIGEAQSTYAAPNWVTSFEVNDGLDKIKNTAYEKKFPAGTNVLDIVKDLLGNANIGELITAGITGKIPVARTFSGDPLKNLEDLQSTYNFNVDIQNGQSIIAPKDVVVNNKYKTRLDISTGLIGTPTVKGNLVHCEALINPDLSPSNFVELAPSDLGLQGNYIIEKATYKGDTWGGGWSVLLELKFITNIDPADNTSRILTQETFA